MNKVYINNKEYGKDLLGEMVETREESTVEVYVLEENMSATDLMLAFRACRENPIKTYYYIPKTESQFSDLAYNAIHRGTLRIYDDWTDLCNNFSEYYQESAEYAVKDCIVRSTDNFGLSVKPGELESLKSLMLDTMDRFGAYTAAVSLLRSLQSGKSLDTRLYNAVLRSVTQIYIGVELSVENYRQTQSHFLSVLAAAKINKMSCDRLKEFDGMAVHVLFRPMSPLEGSLDERRDSLVRLAREHVL